MKIFALLTSVLLLTLSSGCGSNPKDSSKQSDGSQITHQAQSKGGSVKGPCSLTGDIRAFEIQCSQPVKGFSLFNVQIFAKRFKSDMTFNGTPYEIYIERDGNNLTGYEKLSSEITLTIIFEDSSTAAVSLWESK